MIAGLVSVCAVLSLVTTVRSSLLALEQGSTFPTPMLMLTLVTVVCTVVIWRGVIHMEDE